MRTWVRTLALLRGLRIRHYPEQWCGSQRRLGSSVAVALVEASSCSSNSTPSLWEPPYAEGAALKRPKKKKKSAHQNPRFDHMSPWVKPSAAPHRLLEKVNLPQHCPAALGPVHQAFSDLPATGFPSRLGVGWCSACRTPFSASAFVAPVRPRHHSQPPSALCLS